MNPQDFSWGGAPTRFFYDLTPDRILDAVEDAGYACNGQCMALNSMENRVCQIGLESPPPDPTADAALLTSPYLVAKFYRPGRWSPDQILDEHHFLFDLREAEIPVVAPLRDHDGDSLFFMEDCGIYYALFPRIGGRNPDELDGGQLERVGALLGRLHNTGASRPAEYRLRLDPVTYGRRSLEFLQQDKHLPATHRANYLRTASDVIHAMEPLFEDLETLRLHGDAHRGNLLWSPTEGPFWVDFDDMVTGPAVQDIWLLTAGRDDDALRDRDRLLRGYETFRSFPWRELRLIEPLRALRYIHFSAWTAKRWDDPAFPRAFPQFAEPHYWAGQIEDLRECLELIGE